jgi:hypothetical protein
MTATTTQHSVTVDGKSVEEMSVDEMSRFTQA